MDLIDISVSGKRFTWFNSNGTAMSRIDRFLLSEGVIDAWKISSQVIGDRDISDHCPIWLDCSVKNWGPKPFRFFNSWVEHPGFHKLVKETWSGCSFQGWKAYILNEKLKFLKGKLKVWNKEVFGIMDLYINNTVNELNQLDELVANGDPVDEVARNLVSAKFWRQIRAKDSFLHQKSRVNWFQNGDLTLSFFMPP